MAEERNTRIVIADDGLRARRALRALLGTCQTVEVVGEARNGDEATRLVAQHHPDAVLMDARMPVLDGLSAARLIKQQCPQTRVVVLTMYADRREAALAAGADAFLLKGCPLDDLLGAIHQPPLGPTPNP